MQSMRSALLGALRRASAVVVLSTPRPKGIPKDGEIAVEMQRPGQQPRYATLSWSGVRGHNVEPREGPRDMVPVMELATGIEYHCPYPVSNRLHRLVWVDRVGPYRVPVQAVNDILFSATEGPVALVLGGVTHWVRAVDEQLVRKAQREARVHKARKGRKGSR